jgi:hypothetical protein
MPFGNTRTIEADRWKTATTTGTERMREHPIPEIACSCNPEVGTYLPECS